MSRDDGFAIADLDAGLFSDPKVVALARRLRDPIQTAAHVALYQALILGSWGAGVRITFADALPAWWLEPADDIAANLRAVGLLDADGYIPDHAWKAWFLPAWNRREARRDKASQGGRARGRSASSVLQVDFGSAPSQPVRTDRTVPTDRTDPSGPPNQINPSVLLAPHGARGGGDGSSNHRDPAVDRV